MMKLLRHLRPFMWPAIVVVSLVAAQSIAQLYLPNLMAEIVDRGVARNDVPLIWRVGGRMLLVSLGAAVAALVAGYLSARVAAGYGRELRAIVFGRISSFSLQEFDQLGTASLIVRTTNDITQVQMVVLMGMRMMIMAPLQAVGGVIMAVSLDPGLSALLAVAVPFLLAVVVVAGAKALPMFRSLQAKLDRLNLVMRERLTGIRVIRAFDRNEYEEARFDSANHDLTETALRVNRLMAVIMPFMMFTLGVTMIAALYFGGYRVDAGQLEVGALMAFIQYAMQIMMSFLMMSMVFVMLPRASASAERINEVLRMQPTVVDPPAPQQPATREGKVEFRDVTFAYPGALRPALSGVSFTARPGQVTAVIGGTGAGKSTLASLILRFYDVGQGQVLVDGVDVRAMAQAELRSRIGYVPQKAALFTGTVSENVRMGNDDATDDAVRAAADVAQATEFVAEMPEGFSSVIAQAGVNVSGGQKQRLSIARAVARRPSVYILDDCFSALDFRTDARLRQALRQAARSATVLVVAQRVSTVMDADQILVLDAGRLVASGTHRELLATSDVYREIVASQLPEEVVA
jgi:ATP-binding cassette subfamily B protein